MKVCMYVCMYVCMFAHAGRGNGHFLGLHRQNETYMKKLTLFPHWLGLHRQNETYMKKSTLFETALVHVCMYVCMGHFGHISSPCMAKHTYIHTYASTVIYFLDVFGRFRLKTWPWPWKWKCPNSRILKCMYRFPRQAWANIHGILVLRWCKNPCKNRIDEL